PNASLAGMPRTKPSSIKITKQYIFRTVVLPSVHGFCCGGDPFPVSFSGPPTCRGKALGELKTWKCVQPFFFASVHHRSQLSRTGSFVDGVKISQPGTKKLTVRFGLIINLIGRCTQNCY